MELIESGTVFDLYGRWNGLLAIDERECFLGIVRAHDGDFFPESIMDYVDAIRAQVSHRSSASSSFYPVRVDIDVTQVCNANCTFCFSRPYQRVGYRGQFATEELLKRVISDLGRGGTKSIRFCGGGDPMAHPAIRSILPLAHSAGMSLCLITNLDFIDDQLSGLILDNVDHLRWSVNAATHETRFKIHRPGNKANDLNVSIQLVRTLVRLRRGRCPLISATFLVLPSNFLEMSMAARLLQDVGVDSISFRPVFHGLGASWTKEELAALPDIFDEVSKYDDRPRFSVFLPKRDLRESSALDPNVFFSHCQSRHLRTVLEATSAGLTMQSCGMYRGTGFANRRNINLHNPFDAVWARLPESELYPSEAPAMCKWCIDVSMNVTLGAIAAILHMNHSARFYRVCLNARELRDLDSGPLLVCNSDLPSWARIPDDTLADEMSK
jgi:MoaA/NifB/PqqE/SkfB family radical SAM enzyme